MTDKMTFFLFFPRKENYSQSTSVSVSTLSQDTESFTLTYLLYCSWESSSGAPHFHLLHPGSLLQGQRQYSGNPGPHTLCLSSPDGSRIIWLRCGPFVWLQQEPWPTCPTPTIQHLPSLLHSWLCTVFTIPYTTLQSQAREALSACGATHEVELGKSHPEQRLLHSPGTYLLHLCHGHLHGWPASCCSSLRCLKRDKKTNTVPYLAQLQCMALLHQTELPVTALHVYTI